MIDNNINGFPSQKRSFKEKNDKWYRDCVDSAERIAIFGDEKIRQSYYNKKANYDLANDVLNTEDVEKKWLRKALEFFDSKKITYL